jgi:Protein of unknown function (DUF1214)
VSARVGADTPAADFSSMIVYGRGSNAFIDNRRDRVAVSSSGKDNLTANDGGSADVYIGPRGARRPGAQLDPHRRLGLLARAASTARRSRSWLPLPGADPPGPIDDPAAVTGCQCGRASRARRTPGRVLA